MLRKIAASKSKTCKSFCFLFLFGVAAASWFGVTLTLEQLIWVGGAVVGLAIVLWHQPHWRIVLLLLFACMLGLTRTDMALAALPSEDHLYENRDIAITATIVQEPDVRLDGVRYVIAAEGDSATQYAIERRLQMQLPRYPRFAYGDKLAITCALTRPEAFDGFAYDMYLARRGIGWLCENPTVTFLSDSHGNLVYGAILDGKQWVAAQIRALWPEPDASLVAGLLYGYQGGLGPLQEDFRRTGVSHIVAISGYNITIVGVLAMIIASGLRIRRQHAFWGIVLAIILFVIFTGMSASVVRAGVMGLLVLVATQLGMLSRPGHVLLVAATAMVAVNPLVLRYDAGFQLSVVATLGLLYFSPHIAPYLSGLRVPWLIETTSASVSAILTTLPIIISQFGQVSLVAVIVNVLILWLIPWIMLGGFVAVVASVVPVLGFMIAWCISVMMVYVFAVVRFFAGWEFASVEIASGQYLGWIMAAAVLVLYLLLVQRSQRAVVRV